MARVMFSVVGEARGKARPRMTRAGHTYTPDSTVIAENAVRDAWVAAGRPSFGEAPVGVSISVFTVRPKVHFKRDGSLSAAGLRAVYPVKKPDLDNVVKLVCDALNGLAWRDDSQVGTLMVMREWADTPSVQVAIWERP